MAHEEFRQKGSPEKALAHVVEECGEVMAAAGKTLRFGFLSTNPLVEDNETNKQWLFRELDDLKKAITHLEYEIMYADI